MTATDATDATPDTEFDRGTALRGRPGEPSAYDARLDAGWRIGAGVNGGLLLALAGRALSRELGGAGHSDPLTISAYYLSAATPGPAVLRTSVLRRGRTVSSGQVSLLQPGGPEGADRERLRALATYGDLDALDRDVRTTAAPPEMPPPDRCVTADRAPASFRGGAELLRRLDLRLDPATVGWAVGAPSGTGTIRGWLRLADGRQPDPLALLFAVDALPPVTFDLGLFGWTPTLELTVHVRARPAPGWLRVTHATRNLAGGYLEEDAEVWDEAGRLVAQSRQLAAVPRVTG